MCIYDRNINKLLYNDHFHSSNFMKLLKWFSNSRIGENKIIDNLWENSVSCKEVDELIVEIEKVGKLSNTFSLILSLFSVFLTFALGIVNQVVNMILGLWNAKAKALSKKQVHVEWNQDKGNFNKTLSEVINFDFTWLKIIWLILAIVLVLILINYWKRKKALGALYAYKRKIM